MVRQPRCPRPAACARHRPPAAGFTVVELLVVVTIVALIAAIAMPSLSEFTTGQRLRMASYDLVADMSYARGEAIKRNNSVLVLRNGASWAAGWCVTQGADCSGTAPAPLRQHAALDASIVETTGPSSVAFGLDGRKVGADAATITFDDAGAKASIKCRRVVVDASGRPRSAECA